MQSHEIDEFTTKQGNVKVLFKIGNIDILGATCDPITVKDGRGGIFTWVTDHPILEFNLNIIMPNHVRGNHSHPEFFEYFLVVDGSLFLTTYDPNIKSNLNMLLSSGMCMRTPPGTSHAVHAITKSTCVAMLTKPWDDCANPIVKEEIY